MSQALRETIASGEYKIDVDAVALAMLDQARRLRAARRSVLSSEVFVPAEGIEIRRIGSHEADARPLEGAA